MVFVVLTRLEVGAGAITGRGTWVHLTVSKHINPIVCILPARSHNGLSAYLREPKISIYGSKVSFGFGVLLTVSAESDVG